MIFFEKLFSKFWFINWICEKMHELYPKVKFRLFRHFSKILTFLNQNLAVGCFPLFLIMTQKFRSQKSKCIWILNIDAATSKSESCDHSSYVSFGKNFNFHKVMWPLSRQDSKNSKKLLQKLLLSRAIFWQKFLRFFCDHSIMYGAGERLKVNVYHTR